MIELKSVRKREYQPENLGCTDLFIEMMNGEDWEKV